MKPYAFGIIKNGHWHIFCPPCWGKMWPRRAEAKLLDSNGDQVHCVGCGEWEIGRAHV